MVKKITAINFIVNVFLFLVMAAIGGIGLLMKYKLVSGEERWEIYGSNPDLYLWGWDRHEWGDIHLILGYVFFGLLFLHIFLHWSQIKGIYQVMIKARSWQLILVILFVILSLFMLFFAFITPIDVVPLKAGEGRNQLESGRHDGTDADFVAGRGREVPGSAADEDHLVSGTSGTGGENLEPPPQNQAPREEQGLHEDHEERSLEIYGTHSIGEIAERYNVPAELLKKALGIPVDRPDSERLGRLRRQYGFHMSDVERFIEEYKKNNQ